jgi:SAM-dependent methyltransferase
MTAIETAPEAALLEEFVGKALGDVAGAMATNLATLGDALGLWKDLAAKGPATSDELAHRAGIAERYAREWLAGVHAAGYVDYDPATGVYTLPPHAAEVFAHEGGPVFFGGTLQMTRATSLVFDELCDAFRTGGGVPQAHYSSDLYEGISRFTAGWFDNLLLPVWLPLLPEIEAKLVAGCDVADVGTGAGRALITLAQAFPNSRYVGFDVFAGQVELARANADAAGVSDRVRFEVADIAAGLPGEYDVITTFDVIHDAVDPAGLLRSIRAALRPNGRYICLDINASHKPEENVGPLATLFYACSIQYCMTTSLAHGGAGLGTCGFNPHVAEQMCGEAGFSTVRQVGIDDQFNVLYEATA